VLAIGNDDDDVASLVSFFTQQKNRSFPASRCKFQNAKAPVNDSHSLIKRRPQLQRISSTVKAEMSQEAISQKREKVRSNSTDTDTDSRVVAVAVVEAPESNVSILKGLRQSWRKLEQ
jgi:hypothetical protein